MKTEIARKINAEIVKGITKETQVVYILAGVRKIIEQLDEPVEFARLKFYCDWALHSKMTKRPAQEVVRILDFIYQCMRKGKRAPAHSEASLLIKFDLLKLELSTFLRKFDLRDFTEGTNMWVIFIYLYSRVVEDCPLVMPINVDIDIERIVIKLETANELIEDHLPYKVNWKFVAKGNLLPGEYFILNSYSVAETGRL